MKPNIIQDRCIGCGLCEATTDGKIFEIKEDGLAHAIVDIVPQELEEDAEIAASGCPTGAVELEK